MPEMIERVANAICKAYGVDCTIRPLSMHHTVARAAIAAMREPTEQMIKSAEKEDPMDYGGVGYVECWHAMIDGALK